jgi:hypothetical protein
VIVNHARDTDVEALPTISGTVIRDWELSSYFGWGVYGLNLMLNWSLQQTAPLITTVPVNESAIDLIAFEWALIRSAADRSRNFQAQFQPFRGKSLSIDIPVLHGLGNDLMVSESGVGVSALREAQHRADVLRRDRLFSRAPRTGQIVCLDRRRIQLEPGNAR